MIPEAENPTAAAVSKTAGAERSLRTIHGLTQRLILIEARDQLDRDDLADLHDTAQAIVRESARVLSAAGLSLRLRE